MATCDMSIVQSPRLRCLLEKGTRHRVVSADWLKAGSGIDACVKEFKKGIDTLVEDFAKSSEDWNLRNVRGYADRVLEVVEGKLKEVGVGGREFGLNDLLDDAAGRELKALRRGFVVAYVDIVCKKFYASLLLQELALHLLPGSVSQCRVSVMAVLHREAPNVTDEHRSDWGRRIGEYVGWGQDSTYEVVPESVDDIITRHLAFLSNEGVHTKSFLSRRQLRGKDGPPGATHWHILWQQLSSISNLPVGGILPALHHIR